jgi:hypothetical protein
MNKSERGEAFAISVRLIEQLVAFPVSSEGNLGANMRTAVGRYLSNFPDLIANKAIGRALLACFDTAFLAGATLTSMDNVRVSVLAETPQFSLGALVVNAATIFSFVEQSKIIADMEFKSQTDVDAVIDRMSLVIEEIKVTLSDSFTVADYRNFVALAALLIQHLAATRRKMPRIVKYQFPVNYPSLAMANRIYADGTRAEELAAENKTIHPAFMQRHVVALSA